MIEVKQVSKVYGKKENTFTALSDVNFTIKDNSTVAIVGKSGSGKSTLMHVMSGLDRATSGQVIIDGKDITKMKQKELDRLRAEEIGFIFQSFFVQGNESCYDNVSLPLEIGRLSRGERGERVLSALGAVELQEKAKQKAKNLSGGQKQRLAIARAVAGRPSILFADEPTGNLDTTTGEVVENLLFDYNKKYGTTLIIVTHDEDLANKCDQQIHIQDGRVVKVTSRTNAPKKSQVTKKVVM